MYEYDKSPRIEYENRMIFIRVCPKCGRFVKADKIIKVNYYDQPVGSNSTCSKCGRVEMVYEGIY